MLRLDDVFLVRPSSRALTSSNSNVASLPLPVSFLRKWLPTGYWQSPDLTQAALLSDPSGGEERIYLTGDLGRMPPDGCLEHLAEKTFSSKSGAIG